MPMPNPPLKDRKTSLVLVGILDILIGLICSLIAPLMIFGYLATKAAPTPPAQALSLGMTAGFSALYLGIAALAIWIGIGLCLCRRWARTLLLIAGWVGLTIGVLSMAFMIFLMPGILEQMAQQPNMTPGVGTVIIYAIFSILFVIYILIPGIHVLVLGHPNVRDTCHFRDPKTRWTDALPAPALALSLMLALCSLAMLIMFFYPSLPFFGLLLTGLPMLAFCVVSSGVALWLAWETYHLKMRGWWGSLIFIVLLGLSAIITFATHSIFEIYEKMNIPAQQLELLRQNPIFQGNYLIYICAGSVAIYAAYILYCRKYFMDKNA